MSVGALLYQNHVDDTNTVKSANTIESAKEAKFIIIVFLFFSTHEKTMARICGIAGIGR